jgi:hypothetical protein
MDAVELRDNVFRLPRPLVGHGTLFMLKVKGDSMTGAAIADGDLVVVRQQPVADNGDIVVAQLDETGTSEATVKSLQRINGHAWLMPHHPGYQPLPADDATIPGKVVGRNPARRVTGPAAAGRYRITAARAHKLSHPPAPCGCGAGPGCIPCSRRAGKAPGACWAEAAPGRSPQD